MSWIIYSTKEMFYEIDEINHPSWLNKGQWYNTTICLKLYGKLIEIFIRYTITDRYHLMCYIFAHDKNNLNMKMKESVLEIGQYLKTQQQ